MKKMMKRAGTLLLAGVLGMGVLAGCGSSGDSDKLIRIASKDLTENEIVTEIYALALEDAGYKVERKFNISSSVIHTTITSDEIDVYPEYTGTGLLTVLGMEPLTDEQEVYDTVKEAYDRQYQLTWLDYSAANDGQGLAIRTETAEKYGISTISDLQQHAGELRFASQGEFDERSDGIPALEAVYGPFEWKSSNIYSNALKYQVLENDEADVAPVYTTEGRLVEEQFTLLEDDKHVWPPYNLAPVIRNDVLEEHPDIADILNKISAEFTTENITGLNAKVEIDKEEYTDVAKEFYESIKK
ncbi:glycine betaine ABC transporter substrate-binding protein [Lachnospiraceae bacterium KK002]